jgi:hypothetical protein
MLSILTLFIIDVISGNNLDHALHLYQIDGGEKEGETHFEKG